MKNNHLRYLTGGRRPPRWRPPAWASSSSAPPKFLTISFRFLWVWHSGKNNIIKHYKKFDWFTWTCYIKIINRYETVFDNVILKIGRWKLGKLFFKFFGLSITGKCTVASYLINNLLGVLASPAMKLRQLFLDREQLLFEKRNSFGGQMIRNGSGAGNGSSTSCQTRFEI